MHLSFCRLFWASAFQGWLVPRRDGFCGCGGDPFVALLASGLAKYSVASSPCSCLRLHPPLLLWCWAEAAAQAVSPRSFHFPSCSQMGCRCLLHEASRGGWPLGHHGFRVGCKGKWPTDGMGGAPPRDGEAERAQDWPLHLSSSGQWPETCPGGI